MPGLEMPARGGGAAMLRELREEERSPSVEERLRSPSEDRPEAATEKEYDVSYDNPTDNLTGNLTDNKTVQKAIKPESKPTGKIERNKSHLQSSKQTKQKPIQEDDQKASAAESLSVAQLIRQRAAKQTEQEVLKTVTLKLSPSLDERIERYCFENKMKKQEFWAEAAALYFETVGETE